MIDKTLLDSLRFMYDLMMEENKTMDPEDIGAPLGPKGRVASISIVACFPELERLARFGLQSLEFFEEHGASLTVPMKAWNDIPFALPRRPRYQREEQTVTDENPTTSVPRVLPPIAAGLLSRIRGAIDDERQRNWRHFDVADAMAGVELHLVPFLEDLNLVERMDEQGDAWIDALKKRNVELEAEVARLKEELARMHANPCRCEFGEYGWIRSSCPVHRNEGRE